MKDFLYWSILIFGGFCEAGWAYCLNMFQNGSGRRLLWGAGFCFLYMLSAACLAWASKEISVGTAYAVWTGIGAMGTIIMGFILFNEPMSIIRCLFILMIFVSVVGLKIIS